MCVCLGVVSTRCGKNPRVGGGGEVEHSECVAGSGHEQVGMSAMTLSLDRLFSYHLFF
jgi:hypothetical protein